MGWYSVLFKNFLLSVTMLSAHNIFNVLLRHKCLMKTGKKEKCNYFFDRILHQNNINTQ